MFKTLASNLIKNLLFSTIFFYFQLVFSQEPNDCVNAVTVCGNGNFVSNVNGPGNEINEISGCGFVSENNVFWIRIDVVQAGTLGFDLIPVSTDMQVDYDFWVFGPNSDCANLGSAIRCNTNNPIAEGAPNNHTGINGSTTSTIGGPGNIGTPYVQWLNVQPGQTYYIAIDRFLGDEGFELQWTGTATAGSGAFAEPPVANQIPDYLTCSNNANVGLFDLNTIISDINPDITNHNFNFYNSYADAIDGINALSNLLTNSSNPQTIIAKVTNNTTGCFSLTEFDLVVSEIPDVTMTVSQANVCMGESVTITFSGTPGVTVNYEVNGTPQQAVLDDSGFFSFIDTLMVDTDYQVINAQVINSIDEIICSNSGINDTQSVNVNNIQVPQVTSNGPVCQNETVQITFSGDAGASIQFLLDSMPNTIILGNDGTYQMTIPNASNNIEIALQNVEQTTTPFCTQDLTGNNYTITVNPLPSSEELTPIVKCDFNNSGDEQEVFLLDVGQIVSSENGVTYSFYDSYNNVVNDLNALQGDPNNPNNEISYYNQTNPDTLYIKGENDTTGCFVIMTLDLEVLPIPEAHTPNNLIECDTPPNDGFAFFDLTEAESEILGAQNPNNYNITYYLNQQEAEVSGLSITNPENYENSAVNGETIYARVDIVGDSQCYAITSFDIEVVPSPDATFQLNATCDSATATILGDNGGVFSFATLPTDTANIDPFTGTLSNVTEGVTYQVEYTISLSGCTSSETVAVTINTLPNIVTPTNLQECGIVSEGVFFDLDSKTSEITNGDTSLSVTYYSSQVLAELGNPLDALSSPYQATTDIQTIFVRVENANNCVTYTELTLEVFEIPQALQLPKQSRCDVDNDGLAIFNLTEAEIIIGVNPNWIISYHTTEVGAENGTDIINNPQSYISNSVTAVYVLITNILDSNGLCNTVLPLELEVNPQPLIFSDEIIVCEPETNGFEAFDLQSEIPNILGSSQNSSEVDVVFFEDYLATNQITTNPYYNISAYAQTIYVQLTNLDSGCSALFPYNLNIQTGIELVEPSNLITCDFFENNDGVEVFDLTTVETEILNGQDSSLYNVTYHFTEDGALSGTNLINNPEAYQNDSSPYAQTIYIRVEDLNLMTDCIAVTSLDLEVIPLLEPIIQSVNGSNTLCVDFNTDELLNTLVLTCSLQGTQYTYQWYLNGEAIFGATSSDYVINLVAPGTYNVEVTDTLSNISCNSGLSNGFEVIQSGPPTFVSVTTTEPFLSLQTIIIDVVGYGEYAYQLNDGPLLNNQGVFNNVPAGIHTVTVYDVKTNASCGSIVVEDIQILDYPKFLTPNNDGYNDTWNISGLPNPKLANIYIFDRYGKILTCIKPNSSGWDGTYNGQLKESNDYWFLLTYIDSTGVERRFRAHFTLKR